jgi:hypothetical protein
VLDNVIGFLLRFVYLGVWMVAWYVAVAMTTQLVRWSIRKKVPLNFKVDMSTGLFGVFITLLASILVGVSKLWPDSHLFPFPFYVSPLLVILIMFIRLNLKMFDDIEKDRKTKTH